MWASPQPLPFGGSVIGEYLSFLDIHQVYEGILSQQVASLHLGGILAVPMIHPVTLPRFRSEFHYSEVESESSVEDWRLFPIVIAFAALVAYSIIAIHVTVQEGIGPSGWWTLESGLSRVPLSSSLFFASDFIAQKIELKSKLDFRRMISAGCIGGLLNGVGFVFWLHYVEAVFPLPPSGGNGLTIVRLAQLFAKACLDTMVWGTISNCIGLILRRIAAGDSTKEAARLWSQRYTEVFMTGYKFWPCWQSITYSVVPSDSRVYFVAVGAFFWNTYLSLQSSHGLEDVLANRVKHFSFSTTSSQASHCKHAEEVATEAELFSPVDFSTTSSQHSHYKHAEEEATETELFSPAEISQDFFTTIFSRTSSSSSVHYVKMHTEVKVD